MKAVEELYRDWVDKDLADPDYFRNQGIAFRAGYAAAKAEAPQWQPIESAPKDGTIVDLWCRRGDDEFRFVNCRWGQPTWGTQPVGPMNWLGIEDSYKTVDPLCWSYPLPPPEVKQ